MLCQIENAEGYNQKSGVYLTPLYFYIRNFSIPYIEIFRYAGGEFCITGFFLQKYDRTKGVEPGMAWVKDKGFR